MKKIFSTLFIAILLVSCSEFEEDLKFDTPSYKQLTVENVETDLPVINITADEDEVAEMLKNYRDEIEIEAHFDLYRNKELKIDNELIELEVKGGRSATFALKSLGIKFDDSVDNDERQLINPEKVKSNHSIEKVKSIRLRNSGNDFYDTMLKDASYTELAISLDLDFELTYYEPAYVFLNKEYYGMLNIRTESNSHGVSKLFGKKKKNVTMVKINSPGEIEIKDGDEARVYSLLDKIEQKDITGLKEEIDISSFIDYMAFESLIDNFDWPNNNVRFYAIDEGKFRFVLYDLDYVNEIDVEDDPMETINNGNSSAMIDLFNVLYTDQEFKTAYDARIREIFKDSRFSREAFSAIIHKNMEAIEKDIPAHLEKYNNPETLIEWYQNVDNLKAGYNDRFEALKEYLN
ncbi:CotH kinase family protein [Aureivirga sp. CE67]|uniref:CotH kinase family protein n=1 Tax=Aureivirga sp. CE67 TaxID=1788983 RepID=UPI0018CB4610|nr:CotH kinase family protein [Aureivirga sp. CE67]